MTATERPQSDMHHPAPHASTREVVLAHGGGGQLTDQLLLETVLPRIGNPALDVLDDGAVLGATGGDRVVMTTDGYVVQPWKFAGGNIGHLAVCGTVNDLAVSGAEAMGVSLGIIVTEGFKKKDLEEVLDGVAEASKLAGVPVVTGDTKVIERGATSEIYLTTAGVGRLGADVKLGVERVEPGDVLLVNGPVGEHGLTVMLAREMPEVSSVLRSDVAPLNGLIKALMGELGDELKFMRDATRAGLAGLSADMAAQSGWRVTLEEDAIPVDPAARHAAEMLGLDPLEVANEGKVVMVVSAVAADRAMDVMARYGDGTLGAGAAVIGTVDGERSGVCELHTAIGGRRIVHKPYGEELPRIC